MLRKANQVHWIPEYVEEVKKAIKEGRNLGGLLSGFEHLFSVSSDNKLFFQPSDDFKKREVIDRNKITETLQLLYKNPETACNGRDSFYSQVSSRYVGISRRELASFLENQISYQTHKPVKRKKYYYHCN